MTPNSTNPSNPLNIKDINKRNSIQDNTTPEEKIKQANFVAHWVPERFASLASAYYSKARTIQEFLESGKTMQSCGQSYNRTNCL